MPTYAVLGSTGNVGSSIVQTLLQSPDNHINAFCRSQQKMLRVCPQVRENKKVHFFEGNVDSLDVLVPCLRGTKAVFLAVAATENVPGCSIARETARHVVSALERLRKEKQLLPKLIVLSSASTDHRLMASTPKVLLNLLYSAFSNLYNDLKEAEAFLRSQTELVSAVYIKPGALAHDAPVGYSLSTQRSRSPLTFLDLAAGMVEVAGAADGVWEENSVAVNSNRQVALPWSSLMLLTRGLLFHFLPWTYKWLA